MAPKAGPSKAEQKERAKIAEDKTFGMKNKNKSKAVQKYIKSITANVTGQSSRKEGEARKENEEKKKDLQNKALMASLFNQQVDKRGRAYDPAAKKQAKQEEEDAIAAGKKLKDEIKKDIIEGVANTIRLTNPKGVRMSEIGGHAIIQALKEKHADVWKTLSLLLFIKANERIFWVDDAESTNPTLRCLEDVEAETAPDERPIEEILEEKRRNLPPGGTPVTLETFTAWKEKREADRIAAAQEAASKDKNQKGKGAQGGLSGKDLFTFDASLFEVDDTGAASADEYDERSEHDSDAEDEAKRQKDEEADDDDEIEDGGGDAEGAEEVGARGSEEVAINKELFLSGGDLPDDLDDLDDLDDDEGKKEEEG